MTQQRALSDVTAHCRLVTRTSTELLLLLTASLFIKLILTRNRNIQREASFSTIASWPVSGYFFTGGQGGGGEQGWFKMPPALEPTGWGASAGAPLFGWQL